MMQDSGLTHTLSFGLTIHEGSSDNLYEGCLEARRIRNEVNRLDNEDWDDIHDTVVDNANLVKNTTQLLVQKALKEIETYHDHKDDGWGRPFPYIHESVTNIDMPVLNVIGSDDQFIPPEASLPFLDLISSDDIDVIEFPTDHVGLSVGEASHEGLWPRVCKWFETH